MNLYGTFLLAMSLQGRAYLMLLYFHNGPDMISMLNLNRRISLIN